MLAIGLILLLLAVGGGGYLSWLALQTSTGVPLSGGGASFNVLPITLLAAGAAAVVLLWVGFRLTSAGFRRRRAQRRELKELREAGATTAATSTVTGRPVTSRPVTASPPVAERATLIERPGSHTDPTASPRSTSADSGFERKTDPSP